MQKLLLADHLMGDAKDGHKRVTIRKGRRDVALGELTFEATNGSVDPIVVNVTIVHWCKAKEVPEWALSGDGFADVDHLVDELQAFYPDLTKETEITCIEFHTV